MNGFQSVHSHRIMECCVCCQRTIMPAPPPPCHLCLCRAHSVPSELEHRAICCVSRAWWELQLLSKKPVLCLCLDSDGHASRTPCTALIHGARMSRPPHAVLWFYWDNNTTHCKENGLKLEKLKNPVWILLLFWCKFHLPLVWQQRFSEPGETGQEAPAQRN